MRRFLGLGLGLVFAGSVFAGVAGFRGGFGGGGFRGFGGFPGAGFRSGPRFAGRGSFSPFFPGGFRTNFGFNRSGFGFGFNRFHHRSFFYAPFYYPFGYGYYDMFGPSYDSSYYPQPAAYSYAPVAPSPQVIVISPPAPAPVFEQPARPRVEDYREEPAPQARPGAEQIFFLVPFRDKTVQAAVAYWVEGKTLHFITVAGMQREAPLTEIDREAAAKLNRGRMIQLKLPSDR